MAVSIKGNKVKDIASLFGGMVKTKKCKRLPRQQTNGENSRNDIMRTLQSLKQVDQTSSRVKRIKPDFVKRMRKLKSIQTKSTEEAEIVCIPIESISSISANEDSEIDIENASNSSSAISDEVLDTGLNRSEHMAFTKGMEYVRQLLSNGNKKEDQNKINAVSERETNVENQKENVQKEDDHKAQHIQASNEEPTYAPKPKVTALLIQRWAESIAHEHNSQNITKSKHRWLVHCVMGKFCDREKVKRDNGEYYFNKQSEIDLVNTYCDVFPHKKAKKQNKNRKRKRRS